MDVGGLLPCPLCTTSVPLSTPSFPSGLSSASSLSPSPPTWFLDGVCADGLQETYAEQRELRLISSAAQQDPSTTDCGHLHLTSALVPSLPLGHSFPSHHPLFLILPLPFSGCLVSSIFAQPHCRPPGPAAHSEAAGRSVLRPDWRFLRPAAQTLEPVPLHGHERSLASATPPAAW